MNRFIIIFISLFLLSTPVFAPDVKDACPDKFKYQKKVNDNVLVLSEQWKALSNTEKNYCDCRLKFPKPEACYDMWFPSNKKTIFADTPIVIQLVVVLILVSVFILFAFGKSIRKIINSKASNMKGKQQQGEIKTVIATAKPTQLEKTKPKKEILTWDEPLKPEPKKEEPKKEEPVKEEPQPAEVTITADEEEEIYARIGKELKENRNEGSWLKAYTESDGDEQKAKIAYINNRARILMDELKKKKKENKS